MESTTTQGHHGEYEVAWDGTTVWVNGPDGCNVGRFGRAGHDVHHHSLEQLEGTHCLDCSKHGEDLLASWDKFRDAIRTHHGVMVPDTAKPSYLREELAAYQTSSRGRGRAAQQGTGRLTPTARDEDP